ncbi:NAD(P)-binding protein [Zopfia rhizophila CBS 207.26]|uniref:NAD(P)-binding protein n=1 Tax=Zopfia rhizophila CBS 207.26 TaxID=1314779 RepID=A0A6A6E0G2_9PEZI|nr:NAD(P)-binding protein [Zopfia rhizophila CBS 207.26]
MMKTIAITGGTGAQGGGVANIMLKTPGWKVRAITRNTNSDKARNLASQGAEVVQANFNDENSLFKAFEGANAIFAVTNFWEHLFTGKTQEQSGAIEEDKRAEKATKGKVRVPHLDYKAKVDDRIKSELPDLAKKATYLFFGYYPSNMAFLPALKPFEYPGAFGKYIQLLPTPSTAKIPVSGDMTVTPGIWVRQILANPSKSLGKYADVAPEILTFGEMMEMWSEVTGRQGIFVECSQEDFEKIWGPAGNEMAMQFKFGELLDDWHEGYDFVGMEELEIKAEEVPGFRKAIEGLKGLL